MHVDIDSQKLKADQNILGGHSQKWVWRVWSWDSKVDYLKNEQMKWTDFLNDATNSGKLKVGSMVFGLAWSKIAMADLFMRLLTAVL